MKKIYVRIKLNLLRINLLRFVIDFNKISELIIIKLIYNINKNLIKLNIDLLLIKLLIKNNIINYRSNYKNYIL